MERILLGRNEIMKLLNILLLLGIFIIASTSSALAIGLDEAKNAGLVGEQANGYIGAVSHSHPRSTGAHC